MNDKVTILRCITTLDLPPERVLKDALEQDLQGVVVLGYRKDGSELFCSSYADGGTVVWMMERAKRKLLELADV